MLNKISRLSLCWLAGFSAVVSARAQNNLAIYSDSLLNGFQDWGWAVHNYANSSPVHSGSSSVSVTIATANYDGLAICRAVNTDINSSPYISVSFWINGGASGGQQLNVSGLLHVGGAQNVGQSSTNLANLQTNTWQLITIPLSTLGVANKSNFTGLVIQSRIGAVQPTYYVDDIQLNATPPPALVHVGINATQTLRAADSRWFGMNTAVWDGYFDTTNTSAALTELGTRVLRFPGGSLSDEYHWMTGKSGTNAFVWSTTFNSFVHIATNVGAQAMITVNYGSGTPAEAAGWVRHANVTNLLNFKYWEVGNENHGTWETDSNTFPHDGYTYATRAAQYITQMKAADPTIKIGIPVVTGENSSINGYTNHPIYNARTSTTNYGWTPVVLSTLQSLGVTPDFLVHHVYPQFGTDNDQILLQAASNWVPDATGLRQQITDYFGPGGTNIEILCTENNNNPGPEGRQSTSIVNGLYLADSLAQLMKTEINGFFWWDLRNGTDTTGDFNSGLYGWRTYGDFGVLNGPSTRHPVFYTFKLMQHFARPGDTVLNATSDYSLLSTYAARKANGSLALLVINKHNATNLNAQIALTNFVPWSTATVRAYGIAQDEATRTNAPLAAQDIALTNFPSASTNFTNSFPPYSVTLLTFAPIGPQVQNIGTAGDSYLFQLQGQSGVPYQIQTSTNLTSWTSNSTVTLAGSTGNVTNNTSADARFWRAVWLP